MNEAISADEIVTTTLVTLANIGDYLLTVEQSLISVCNAGLSRIEATMGDSATGKSFADATIKRYMEDHARAFRYSSIILIFTTFESRFALFKEDYEKRYGAGPKKKKPDTFADEIREYMEGHQRSIHLFRPKVWERLRDLNIVRNCIAHGSGAHRLMARKGDRIPKIAKFSPHLEISKDGYLMINGGYAMEACELITNFFNLVFDAADYSMDLPSGAVFALGDEGEIWKKLDEYYTRKGL